MKLQATLEGELYEIEIEERDGRVLARINDRVYDLEVSRPEPGVFLFREGGKITEAFVSGGMLPGTPRFVTIKGNTHEIHLIDPKKLRGFAAEESSEAGVAELKTQMPGKVVRVLAPADTVVEKGDGVIIVEAMKMQNELKAPKAGKIREIKVAEGATVSAGEVLAIIE